MLQYAMHASIGDAVFGDYSTEKFEAHVAKVAGKEAALFFVSGRLYAYIASSNLWIA
jgi:threonine aldolase